jgi:pimeloyl-ACP methyl ester carboxylesterase
MATFCLIHGDWHDGSCWKDLVPLLEDRGHRALAPDLPLDDPEAGFAERVRPAIETLDGVTGRVVLVGHSVGSGYAPLVAASRPVSLLVHLCPRLGPFEPPAGAPETYREGFPFPVSRPDGMTVWDPEAAIASMYGRLSPETAGALATRLRPATAAPGEYPLTGHPDIPTALVYAVDDEIFQPEWERFMARELLGIEPIEIPGGHFPMVEDPEALSDLLDRLAQSG